MTATDCRDTAFRRTIITSAISTVQQVRSFLSAVIWQLVQKITLLCLQATGLFPHGGLSVTVTAMPKPPVTATLLNFPAEIRHKIFYHLMDEDPVKVVGYRSYDRDAFWIKYRGMVLIEARNRLHAN